LSAASPKEIETPSLTDPNFFSYAFKKWSRRQNGDPIAAACTDQYEEISRQVDLTTVQDSCSVRNILRTRALADLLINDKGDLESALLPKIIEQFSASLYSTGPNRQYDGRRQEQILKVLKLLDQDKNLVRLLKNISKPTSHRYAEQIIRETLQLPAGTTVTDTHTRRAALAAWFCYLRQNVGSCFATAPAIIVHDEQPELFLSDLNDLLSTGRLKRTFAGIEYVVPLCSNWGSGDSRKLFYLMKDNEMADIWQSPGFIRALEDVNLIVTPTQNHKKQTSAKAKKLIEGIIKELPHHRNEIITTVEELFRRLLLQNLSLTEQDIVEYDNRPQELIQSTLVIQPLPTNQKTATKGDLCAQFKQKLKQAKNTFNAFSQNPLLKAWEFSLASFAETKADFTRWNLYSSLGLTPQEPHGIGQALFEILQKKLDECQHKIQDIQVEYEQLYGQLKYVESRIKNASTEKEINWLRVEHQSRSHEFYALQDMRDALHDKAKRYAGLYDVLIPIYDILFPQYFQEVYDPDMRIGTSDFYDDAPAGFRLLYKHGRSNTSQWTAITSPDTFINSLTNFFVATENEITANPHVAGIESDISEIITQVIRQIKTKEFLESAFHRMAIAHRTTPIKNPLENLDKIEKKPWMYTSGGTMGSLVSCYFRREQKPTEVERWVENEMELLVFIIDTLKQIPIKIMQEYIQKPEKSMLMHSPTHAFLLKPGFSELHKAWNSDLFTFTWVRDHMVNPMKQFIEQLSMNDTAMHAFIEHLTPLLPKHLQHQFQNLFRSLPSSMESKDFRDHLLDKISMDKAFRQLKVEALSPDTVDSQLFTSLPFFSGYELRDRIDKLFRNIKEIPPTLHQKLLEQFDHHSQTNDFSKVLSAKELQDIAKGLLCLTTKSSTHPFDTHRVISKSAQQLGFALPAPILFGDSNWVTDEFGFVINPGTKRLELWRTDYIGTVGAPMTAWTQWLNGSRQDRTWGVYSRPYEYSL
jgi:hypothetical protein